MIVTRFGRELIELLRSVIPFIDSDPHALLRAYCSFLVAQADNGTDNRIKASNVKLKNQLYAELCDGSFPEIGRRFLGFSPSEFLRFVVPYEVVSYTKDRYDHLMEVNKIENDLYALLSILFSKKIRFDKIVKTANRTPAFDEFNAVTEEAGIPRRIRFPKNYNDFLFWLFCFNIENKEELLSYSPVGDTNRKNVMAALKSMHIMSKDFNTHTRDRFGRILQRIHAELGNCNDVSAIKDKLELLVQDEESYPGEKLYEHFGFSEILRTDPAGDDFRFDDVIEELSRSVFVINTYNLWLDVLCMFQKTQRGRIDIRKEEIISTTRGSERRTDVALEYSILYSLATANAGYGDNSVLIVLPSPYFINRWIKDDKELDGKNCRATFVVENGFAVDVLEEFFFDARKHDNDYIRKLQRRIRFADIHDDDWQDDPYTDIVINEPLLSEVSFAKLKDYLAEVAGNGEDLRIISLCADAWMTDSDRSLFAAIKTLNVSNIILFPEGIGGTEPIMKNIWISENLYSSEDGWCDVYRFSKQTKIDRDEHGHAISAAEDRRLFCNTNSPAKVHIDAYIKSGRPIREIVTDSSTVKSRSTGDTEYRFCNELVFRYHRTSLNKSDDKSRELFKYKVGFEATIRKEVETENGIIPKFVTGLRGELHRPNNMSQDDFDLWIAEKYIEEVYSVRIGKRNESAGIREEDRYNGRTIREWIADTVGKQYKGAAITLRALWVFHPEVKEKAGLSNREESILKEYVFHSDIGNKYLYKISEEEVSDYYESAIIEKYEILYDVVLSTFAKVFDFAVKMKHCAVNPFENIKDSKSDMRKIRSALVKKIFLETEFRKLYSLVLDDVNRGDSLALGILVRLLTGISTSELRSLRFSDFVKMPDYDGGFIYSLQICRRTDLSGLKTGNLPSPENIRIVPLGNKMGEILNSYAEKKASHEIIFSDDGSTVLSNARLAKKLNEYFGKLGLDDDSVGQIKISIPDDKDGFSECILTKYGGDIIRENFRYWASKAAGFSEDEVNACLGVAKSTTLGRFYIDFNNDQTVLYMHVKQCRLEAFLEAGDDRVFKASEMILERINGGASRSRFPLQLDVQLRPGREENVEVAVSNKYGLNVERFSIGTEEVGK